MWETIKDFLKPELVWFLIGLVLMLAELMMPGLVVMFFGVGAWIVAIICLFVDISINTQLVIFIIASLASLFALRKWLKGMFFGHTSSKQDTTHEMSEYVGERAVVTKKITTKIPGKVELHGTNWIAESDTDIEEGTVVEIIDKDNLTLKVKPI